MSTPIYTDSTASAVHGPATGRGRRGSDPAAPSPIPLLRIISLELRKSFDTRAGFWLLTSVAIVSLITTAAVTAWADRNDLTYVTYTQATSIPMSIILPLIATLSVTSEWSQRTGLTTFTLIPHRGRVLTAKAAAAGLIAVTATLLAFVAGAAGNLAGSAIADIPTVWNHDLVDVGYYTLSNVLLMLVGFTLAVLIRHSTGAIVAFFIYALVAPPLLMTLATNQPWFHDAQPWVDPIYNQDTLLQAGHNPTQWAQLAITNLLWVAVPLIIGVRNFRRAEVK